MSKQEWTTDRPTEPGEYWVSIEPSRRALPSKGYPLAVTLEWKQRRCGEDVIAERVVRFDG